LESREQQHSDEDGPVFKQAVSGNRGLNLAQDERIDANDSAVSVACGKRSFTEKAVGVSIQPFSQKFRGGGYYAFLTEMSCKAAASIVLFKAQSPDRAGDGASFPHRNKLRLFMNLS